jgi:phage baseplate assembly protein W
MSTFIVPAEATGSVEVSNNTEIDFYGVDLYFTDDIQLSAAGDYATVQGLEALRQAIRSRLLTTPGEYAVHPEYGCGLRQFCKKRATQSDRDALRQIIIDQLSQEERIQNVDEVTIESFTSGAMTGVKVFVRVTALGRENSFQMQTFAE